MARVIWEVGHIIMAIRVKFVTVTSSLEGQTHGQGERSYRQMPGRSLSLQWVIAMQATKPR